MDQLSRPAHDCPNCRCYVATEGNHLHTLTVRGVPVWRCSDPAPVTMPVPLGWDLPVIAHFAPDHGG